MIRRVLLIDGPLAGEVRDEPAWGGPIQYVLGQPGDGEWPGAGDLTSPPLEIGLYHVHKFALVGVARVGSVHTHPTTESALAHLLTSDGKRVLEPLPEGITDPRYAPPWMITEAEADTVTGALWYAITRMRRRRRCWTRPWWYGWVCWWRPCERCQRIRGQRVAEWEALAGIYEALAVGRAVWRADDGTTGIYETYRPPQEANDDVEQA